MKHEWKKQESQFYSAKTQPQMLNIPAMNFIMISGQGDPNLEDFAQRISALYALAYPLKMAFKATQSGQPGAAGFSDYTIYPLEGIWSSTNPADLTDKSSFIYTIMIRQPEVISLEQFAAQREQVLRKKQMPLLNEVRFECVEEGLCAQILHLGSFDDEPASFAKLDQFTADQGYERLGYWHREIYLSDARKTAPNKRKTILRYQVGRVG